MENNKINIAEILRRCPSGMELDCTMYENCTFEKLEDVGYTEILVKTPSGRIRLTKEGCFTHSDEYAKCVIFPKGKTTWEGFQGYFKDGDIVATDNGEWIGITTGGEINKFIPTYCVISFDDEFEAYLDIKETWKFSRLATEDEKQKLLDAIKDNGYRWNEETKTLEKLVEPKFKVGDRIKHRLTGEIYMIMFVLPHGGGTYEVAVTNEIGKSISIKEQDNYELMSDKFDISTLVPFDKVLVRHNTNEKWDIDFFSCIDNGKMFRTITGTYVQCIPYEGNEHLLDTDKDCIEYYKTWKD